MIVGDFVKGLPGSPYRITDERMTRGIVRDIAGDEIRVEIIEHENDDGGTHWVFEKYFEVIGHARPFDCSEFLELLKNGCKKAVLEFDMYGANLEDVDLEGTDLEDLNFCGAKLNGAKLNGAKLNGAKLNGAELNGAELNDAELNDAELNDAELNRAELNDAKLNGAKLNRAELNGAKLNGAEIDDGTNFDFSCWPLWCGSLRIKAKGTRQAAQLAYHLCSMQCDDAEYIEMRNSILSFANKFHRASECGILKPIEREDQN